MKTDTPQTKQVLRGIYREKRLRLSANVLNQLNTGLLDGVKQLDFSNTQTIHLFLPIAGNHEPDTMAIASWLRGAYPGVRLATSKTTPQTMSAVSWEPDATLTENQWKIPEPERCQPIAPEEIDALFVPLLAFDKKGHRVGYGKGFYDRFLSDCRPDVVKIGLSLFDPIEAISDLHPHDIPLSLCVTPTRKWVF